jgi:hypothetical protein
MMATTQMKASNSLQAQPLPSLPRSWMAHKREKKSGGSDCDTWHCLYVWWWGASIFSSVMHTSHYKVLPLSVYLMTTDRKREDIDWWSTFGGWLSCLWMVIFFDSKGIYLCETFPSCQSHDKLTFPFPLLKK